LFFKNAGTAVPRLKPTRNVFEYKIGFEIHRSFDFKEAKRCVGQCVRDESHAQRRLAHVNHREAHAVDRHRALRGHLQEKGLSGGKPARHPIALLHSRLKPADTIHVTCQEMAAEPISRPHRPL